MKNIEYGIIVLKPDAMEKAMLNNLIDLLKNLNFEIIRVKNVTLSYDDVIQHFASNFNPVVYAEYMSRREVGVILIGGERVGKELGVIKNTFRKRFGYSSDNMENLVHTVDQGNEYFRQFKLFFPELDLVSYTKYADMNIVSRKNEHETIAELKFLDKESSLSWAAVVQETGTICRVVEKFKVVKDRLNVLLGLKHLCTYKNSKKIIIIGYFPEDITVTPYHAFLNEGTSFFEYIQWVKGLGGIAILDYIPLEEVELEMLLDLKKAGMHGVNIYDPRRSITEAEELEDIIESVAGLLFSGGGNGYARPGEMALGRYEFDKLYQEFKVIKL